MFIKNRDFAQKYVIFIYFCAIFMIVFGYSLTKNIAQEEAIMKNIKRMLFLVLAGLLLMNGGCAQRTAPSFALVQPEQGMTVEHPDQFEKDGGTIVTFTGVLPPRFLVEVDKGVRGVWPLVGSSITDEEAPIVDGFCYSVPSQAFAKNPWAIIPMQCAILGSKREFTQKDYVFALVNKDGGVWIASPIGAVPTYDYTIVDDQTYDFVKFEDNFEYRAELMREIGKSIPVINETWQKRIEGFGFTSTTDDVQEIEIVEGNPQWEAFREKLLSEMGEALELPDGQIVASYMSEEDMETLLSKNPMITPWQRFLAHIRVPIGTPEVMAFGAASSFIDGGIAAFFDNQWNACVARGTCQRRDMSEQLAFMFELYQREHVKRMGGGE